LQLLKRILQVGGVLMSLCEIMTPRPLGASRRSGAEIPQPRKTAQFPRKPRSQARKPRRSSSEWHWDVGQ